MLRSAAHRLLARFRRGASASAAGPVRQWEDDLSEVATTADAWVARRLTRDWVYVAVSEDGLARLQRTYPHLCQATLDTARRLLAHEFDLLGSGPFVPVDPGRSAGANGYQPIDWSWDPVAGQRFPVAVPLVNWNFDRMRPGLADIKFPWELARCQHWPTLGQAYRLTGEERFAIEIANQLRDFIDANPVGTAVNWACTMDVALRAANWAIGLQLVRDCRALDEGFWRSAFRALFDHGAFIEGHLENAYEVTSNHFLSNIVGLFFLAAVFDDLPGGQLWGRQCRAWLEQELHVQVLPDGADYESSVPYHRLVCELFLGAVRLADFVGVPLPPAFRERVAGMIAFLAAVERPDGLMPQVGDADDGRLHVLSEYGTWMPEDGRHLFGPASAIFERQDWAARTGEWGAWERAWWGFDAVPPPSVWRPGPAKRDEGIAHFPAAGLTVLRSRKDYLLVTNGVVGTAGFGNHKHNDQLGFEYHADGCAIFVDPGSYVYTSDPGARNLFRSTAYHNTVSIDAVEQNELRPEWLFRLFATTGPEHVDVGETAEALRYCGRHHGYGRLPEPLVHERAFVLTRQTGTLTIVDRLTGSGRHRIRWHFHLAPGVEIGPVIDGATSIRTDTTTLHLTTPAGLRHTVGTAWYSPSYGIRVPSACLESEADEHVDGTREYTWTVSR